MRQEYQRRYSSSGSECSDHSYRSRSTAPSDYSGRPSIKHQDVDISYRKPEPRWDSSLDDYSDPRASAETYASTIPSDEGAGDEYPVYEEPSDYYYEPSTPPAYPSTPSEFGAYFPSTRKLCIRHDDTIDGNMNLRVDTEFRLSDGQSADLTLFHLRMHDLKNREFSLRRYCRDSGREVCHSSRKYVKPAIDGRPALQRSVSNALATLKSLSDNKRATKTSLKRTDSGYDSMSDDDDALETPQARKQPHPSSRSLPTNTTNLEFSNYAHLDLKRRGTKSSKRYEFEYWGQKYVWRRMAKRDGPLRESSYHLYVSDRVNPIAHIVPLSLSPEEAAEEEEKGGWVPPSSLWLSDMSAVRRLDDLADVIIATGLMAFVDDCIKNKWHRKDRFSLSLPTPFASSKGANPEYVGPKKLIDGMFGRAGTSPLGHSPLRQITTET